MGTNCRPHPGPVPTNTCGPENEVYEVPNFCSYRMGGKSEFCTSMSSSKEWNYHSRYDYCYSHGTTNYGFGCCRGTCGSPFGTKLKCGRVKFAGKPVPCCLQDYTTCGGMAVAGNRTCFVDDDKQSTCAPKYRDITGPDCRKEILKYCSGVDLVNVNASVFETEFTKRWTGTTMPQDLVGNANVKSSPCYYAMWRNMYDKQGQSCLGKPFPGVSPNASGYIYTQKLFNGMLRAYIANGGTLVVNAGSAGTTYLNNVIKDICMKYPGICEVGLKAQCSGKTLRDLAAQPSLQKWCGCYLPDAQYSTYTDVYRISKECTASCNAKGVIPLATSDGIGIKKCTQSTCVIDDISIEMSKNTNAGDINFTQICPSCSDGGNVCSCTLAGTTMKIVDSKVPNINLSQNCGSGSACFKEVKDLQGKSSSIRVPCSADGSYDPYKAIKEENLKRYYEATNKRNLKIFIMIVVVIVILFVMLLIVSPANVTDEKMVVKDNPVEYYPSTVGGSQDILSNGLARVDGYQPPQLNPNIRDGPFSAINETLAINSSPFTLPTKSLESRSLRDNMNIPKSKGAMAGTRSLRGGMSTSQSMAGSRSLRGGMSIPQSMAGSRSLRGGMSSIPQSMVGSRSLR